MLSLIDCCGSDGGNVEHSWMRTQRNLMLLLFAAAVLAVAAAADVPADFLIVL